MQYHIWNPILHKICSFCLGTLCTCIGTCIKNYNLPVCSSSMFSVSPTHVIFVPVICLPVNKSRSCKLVVGLGGKEQWRLPIIIQSINIGIISQEQFQDVCLPTQTGCIMQGTTKTRRLKVHEFLSWFMQFPWIYFFPEIFEIQAVQSCIAILKEFQKNNC